MIHLPQLHGPTCIRHCLGALILALLLVVTSVGARDFEGAPGKRYIYKSAGGRALALEVYFPTNQLPAKSKAPGLLLFHGGGWTGGDLHQFRYACQYFARRGLVARAATANYRTLSRQDRAALPAGESRKRVCITDAKCAIRWMKQRAEEFGFNPDQLIVGGSSAGGHIAILATTNPGLNDPSDPKDFDTSVVAYLLFSPAFAEVDSKDAEVDALKHLKAKLPPAIVFSGTADTWKPGWDVVQAHLKSLGQPKIQLWLAADQKHGFLNDQPWQDLALIKADRFLVSLGLLQGEPTLVPNAMGQALNLAP